MNQTVVSTLPFVKDKDDEEDGSNGNRSKAMRVYGNNKGNIISRPRCKDLHTGDGIRVVQPGQSLHSIRQSYDDVT